MEIIMRKLWLIGHIDPLTLESKIENTHPMTRQAAVVAAMTLAKSGYFSWMQRKDTGAVGLRATPHPATAAELRNHLQRLYSHQASR